MKTWVKVWADKKCYENMNRRWELFLEGAMPMHMHLSTGLAKKTLQQSTGTMNITGTASEVVHGFWFWVILLFPDIYFLKVDLKILLSTFKGLKEWIWYLVWWYASKGPTAVWALMVTLSQCQLICCFRIATSKRSFIFPSFLWRS